MESARKKMVNSVDKVRIPECVSFTHIGQTTVLVNLRTGAYIGLDKIGGLIWELIKMHGEIDAVVEAMMKQYKVEESVLRADIYRLVMQFYENEFVVVS